MDLKSLKCTDCDKQSLMNTINKFLGAVSVMDEKVMIPSKLKDMSLDSNSKENSMDNNSMDSSEENNNVALLPMGSQGQDLYSHYVMLNTIKKEIVSGNISESDDMGSECSGDDSDDSYTDNARETAAAFRHHLQGLFGLLHQLTHSAKFLGEKYEGDIGSGKKIKKFVF